MSMTKLIIPFVGMTIIKLTIHFVMMTMTKTNDWICKDDNNKTDNRFMSMMTTKPLRMRL